MKSGNGLYDRELERRLEVRQYPRISGELKEVKPLGSANRYHVRGDLSFHGRTHAVEGDVTLRVVDDETIEIEGENVFDMRNFGIDPPKILMLRVYPEVRVRARVVVERES